MELAKKCYICSASIKALGSFVQRSLGKVAHLQCYHDLVHADGLLIGREQVFSEQREKARQAEAQQAQEKINAEVRARNYVSNLPRCPTCGKRVNAKWPHQYDFIITEDLKKVLPALDLAEPSEGALAKPGVCATCIEVERVARNEARKEISKESKKEQEPLKDRFSLIDLD